MKIIAILLLLNAPFSMAMENQEMMNDEGLKRTYSQAFPDEEKACFEEQTKRHCAELCSFDSAKEELALARKKIKNALAVLEDEAKSGCPKANFSLGKFYEKGNWVEMDRYKASQYFEVAANGGHVGALYHLGKYQIYEVEQLRNKGIPNEMNEFLTQNGYNRAVKYFQQAAMKGHLTASFTLGHMYHRGTGVQKDLR
jgi:TPR repeat protein